MENIYFKSERLLYRPFEIDDLKTLVKFRNEKSMRKWFYFQEPDCLTEEFALKTINESKEIWSKKVNILKDDCCLAMVLKETGELIGNVGIVKRCRPEVKMDGLEIGYSVGEEYQRKGFATEGAKAAIKWAFSRFCEININPKIEAYIEHENWPSRRVAEKAGFVFDRTEKYVTVYTIDAYTHDVKK